MSPKLKSAAYTFRSLTCALFCSLGLSYCAGPATPFGANNKVAPPEKESKFVNRQVHITELTDSSHTQTQKNNFSGRASSDTAFLNQPSTLSTPPEATAEIIFYPDRQVLHSISELTIIINSATPINAERKLKFYYDGTDVTNSILANSEVKLQSDQKSIQIKISAFRFPGFTPHHFIVYFQATPEAPLVSKTLGAPSCNVFARSSIKNTGSFKPTKKILQYIKSQSRSSRINPNLLAGLIAKESGFNTEAISWAKAIGLTQVTTIAEKEITSNNQDWPRHPSIPQKAFPLIKALIASGSINKSNEWRLNPKLSIRGGAIYLKQLNRYWSKSKNKRKIISLSGDDQYNKTLALLASYNSGAARVNLAMKRKGDQWLNAKNLKEAKKYSHSIVSYCYHFSKERKNL